MNTRIRSITLAAAMASTAAVGALAGGSAQAAPGRWNGGAHTAPVFAGSHALGRPVFASHGYRGGYYRGGYGYRYGGPGVFWGGLGLGLGIGALAGVYNSTTVYPGYVVETVPPPVTYYPVPVQAAPQPAPAPTARSAPDPVIYPRDGQSPERTEADRQACNRWATTQPSAMADASVFQRATLACLEGRGYTVR